MNRTHRTIWSQTRHAYVVAPETAKTVGKSSTRTSIVASVMLALTSLGGTVAAADLPHGGSVVAGSASVSVIGNQMTIHQSSDKLVSDWKSFSIGQGKTVEFIQPSTSSVALNRVLGTDVSVIQGSLKANGQIFLVNPNGVTFTKDAQVNVGGIVASTLTMSTDDFLAGNYRFAGESSGTLLNQGNITAASGGTVALIAAKISNTGQIHAERGNVLMGAGRKVKLDWGGPTKIEVEEGALDALIEQGGGIRADGGLVYLTAKAVSELTTTVINHTGITEARTLATGERGQIYLMGGMDKDRIVVAGKLDASAPNGGDGGFIETSAAHVQSAPDLKVRAGHWLIDPADITVDATMAGALEGQLSSGDASVQTTGSASGNGDIFISSGITWNSGRTLTLKANRHIAINATLDASGGSGGKLALEYGQGAAPSGNSAYYLINAPVNLKDGANFSTVLGALGTAVNYTVISGASVNSTLNGNRSGNYALGAELALAAPAAGSSNWTPVGGTAPPSAFFGRFDGLGHTISGMTLLPSTVNAGLFSLIDGATISNIKLTNVSIEDRNLPSAGNFYVGALAGDASDSTIRNVSATGTITSSSTSVNKLGGLIGQAVGSTGTPFIVDRADSAVEVSTSVNWTLIGGLVGKFFGNGAISYSRSTGGVTSTGAGPIMGGLVGYVYQAAINNSNASGPITATNAVNGNVGGLVGWIDSWTTPHTAITNSYSSSAITATGGSLGAGDLPGYVGGLVGAISTYGVGSPTISNSFARGSIAATGSTSAGGLIGYREDALATVNQTYWDSTTSTLSNAIAAGNTTATGLTNVAGQSTADMKKLSTYVGWAFTADSGDGEYPILTQTGGTPYWKMAPAQQSLIYTLSPRGANGSVVYKGTDYDLSSLWTASDIFVASGLAVGTHYEFTYNGGTVTTLKDAGTYSGIGIRLTTTGSVNYVLAPSGHTLGTLTIAKAPLTVTADNKSRVYGSANPALTASITGFVNGENLASSGVTGSAGLSTAATASTGAGTADIVAALGTLAANNYDFSFNNGTLTIAKAPLTVTADDKSRVYGSANPALTASITGFANGENLASSGVTGSAGLSTAATLSTGVGTANIVAALGTLAANNYDFSFVNGALTIAADPNSASKQAAISQIQSLVETASLAGTSTTASSLPKGSGRLDSSVASAGVMVGPTSPDAGPALVQIAGGLVLLQDGATSANTGQSQGETRAPEQERRRQAAGPDAAAARAAGRDASGFMKVFVIGGGVNTNLNLTGGR